MNTRHNFHGLFKRLRNRFGKFDNKNVEGNDSDHRKMNEFGICQQLAEDVWLDPKNIPKTA